MKLLKGQTYWIKRDGTGEIVAATVYAFGLNMRGQRVVHLKCAAGTRIVRDARTLEGRNVDCISLGSRYADVPIDDPPSFPAAANLVALHDCYDDGLTITPDMCDHLGLAVVYDRLVSPEPGALSPLRPATETEGS